MKKSVIIEGQKSRSSIRNGKSFNRMDQKSQLQIKKIIQASKTSERLDLSERNILSLNSQIADLNETLKGKLVRPIHSSTILIQCFIYKRIASKIYQVN